MRITQPGGIKNTADEIRNSIVNDATRFPGANIDATISSRSTWSPTFERYADVSVASGGSYTPADAGIFAVGAGALDNYCEYYSTQQGAWKPLGASNKQQTDAGYICGSFFIGDGANFRVYNNGLNAYYWVLMRMY